MNIDPEWDYNPQEYLPRGYYPWPDLIHPSVEQFDDEYCRWVDEGYAYLTDWQREQYKKMRLHYCTARMLPYGDSRWSGSCHRFLLFQVVFDDQLEFGTRDEVIRMGDRLCDIFKGDQPVPDEIGLYHEAAKIRDEFRAHVPEDWMRRFIKSLDRVTRYGAAGTMAYKAAKKTIPLTYFKVIREYDVLMYPYLDMVEPELDLILSDELYEHPLLQRMRSLTCRLIAWQNDIHTLHKELAMESETSNLMFVLQRERGLSVRDTLADGMRIHDDDLAELITLEKTLPDFGKYQRQVERYALGLGTAIQGVNSFYILDTPRYRREGAGFAWPQRPVPSLEA